MFILQISTCIQQEFVIEWIIETHFWRTGKHDRNTVGDSIPNSMGNNVKQSCWPLDPYDNFATRHNLVIRFSNA